MSKHVKLALFIVCVLWVFLSAPFASASSPTKVKLSVEWQHYLPGVSSTSVIQTSDGGYLALGLNASIYTRIVASIYTPIDINETYFQTIAVKTDSSGNLVWSKTYSLENDTNTQLVQAVQTNDGYILAGSFGELASLVKIDLPGNILWQKNLSNQEGIETFTPTNDGGFIVGVSLPNEAPSPPEFGVVKLDSEGNIQWQMGTNVTTIFNFSRVFWGTVTSISQTSDGGYIIVSTESTHAYLSTPIQMFKLDSGGNLQWSQTYNNYYTMYAKSSVSLADGYLIVGGANIPGEQVTGLILKTDLNGNLIWNKTYMYSDMPSSINSVSLSNNGSLMFVGYVDKNVGATTYGSYTWVAQVDSLGNVQGQLAIDMGNHLSNPTSIIQATDGGHVFVGVWNETTGFINQQFWLVEISTTASSIPEFPSLLTVLILTIAVSTSLMVLMTSKRHKGCNA